MRPNKAQRLLSVVGQLDQQKTAQIASIACGLEALDALLVEKGVFRDNELMEKMERVILQKAEEAEDGNSRRSSPTNHGASLESGQGRQVEVG